jgi:protein KRI1
MFEDDDERQDSRQGFRINKKFEHSFNERKAREDLERAKAKFGNNFDSLGQDGTDSSLPEDEDAVLDDEEVTLKVLNTLSKIKNKNPDIYDPSTRFYEEKDLKKGISRLESGRHLGKREGGLTYKRQMQAMAAAVEDGDVQEEESEQDEVDETPIEHQQRVKREFQAAAMAAENEDDDAFFTVKQKTKVQAADEEEQFLKFVEIQKSRSKSEAKELKKAWGNKEKLDDGEKFLRNYILTKGWISNDDDDGGHEEFTHFKDLGETNLDRTKLEQKMLEADQEDEKREEEIDKFEEKINFRFERPGGNKIQTFERDVDDTMRRKDETRADKRKEKDQRKKEEKNAFRDEIEHLKELKRDELNSKIKKLLLAGGLGTEDKAKKLQDLSAREFNEEDYDKQMQSIFNENYYDEEDEAEDELLRYVEEAEAKVDSMIVGEDTRPQEEKERTAPDAEEDVALHPSSSVPILMRKKLNNDEASVLQQSMKDNLWWYCDNCNRGIKPLEARFDCMECDDYTECKQCADLKGHDHQMKKFIVPEGTRL